MALNTADFMKKLRDFVITTCGWTSIQDTVLTTGAASTYFAASSTGEAGTSSNTIRFLRGSAGQNTCWGSMYLSWAAGAGKVQAGVFSTTAATGTHVRTDDNNYFTYWLFGSLDRIIIVTQPGFASGVSDTLYVGSYTPQRTATFSTCTNAPAAGSAVVFSTASTAGFTVGKRYVIADANGFEYPKVTAISGGVSITLDVLQNSYAIGARLGEDPRPGFVSAQGAGLGLGSGNNFLLAGPYDGGLSAGNAQQITQGGVILRTVDQSLVERASGGQFGEGGIDGGGSASNGLFDLWPLFIADESMQAPGLMGTLTEVYTCPRNGIVTDDTITVGGSTYHFINTASPVTATGTGAVGLAIRRA